MTSQDDPHVAWATALTGWEAALVSAGRTPHTIRLWASFVRRASSLVDTPPSVTPPSALMEAIGPRLGSAATKANARTAIRSFYRHTRTFPDDPVVVVGRDRQLDPEWSAAIRAWEVWLRVGGRSAKTIALQTYYMRRLGAELGAGPWEVTLNDLLGVLDNRTWAPETRKAARSSLRSFYTWAMDVERVAVDPTRRLPSVPVPIGKPRPAPDAVFAEALASADKSERLMLLLAAYAGLRRSEIAAVHSRDIQDGMLRIVGKGRRTRLIPLHPVLEAALADVDGWAFPGRFDDHAHPDLVGKTLSRLLPGEWTGHTLRHRFASKAYAAQRDIRAVQELLGHAKLETTQIYTAIPDDALRAAVMAVG
jgi:integrase